MADNKKYYYLKLKDNFYDSEEMIILQNMQDGYLYSDILMKLYLRSLKTGGKLMFNNLIPYTPQVLAQVVRHQVGTVEKALRLFKDLGLIEILDNGAIFMLNIQNFIGQSSTEADRIRNYRMEIDQQKTLPCTNVQQMYNKSTPEIDIELELYNKYNSNEQKTCSYDTEFEKLWNEYPNKKGKKDAQRHYIKARKKGVEYETIEAGLKNYIEYIKKANIKQQYIKHGSTWFNEECWNDDYTIKSKKEELEDIFKRIDEERR